MYVYTVHHEKRGQAVFKGEVGKRRTGLGEVESDGQD